MASQIFPMLQAAAILFFLSSILPSARGGGIVCENLPRDLCTFAVSATSKRCLLETTVRADGRVDYECRTSEVTVEHRLSNWIETDGCIRACGVDRGSVGISSDALLDRRFTEKLCSHPCYHNCPNIVDLYFNLAAAEGAFLPEICENPRRSTAEILSSGVAAGPATAAQFIRLDDASAPVAPPSPFS